MSSEDKDSVTDMATDIPSRRLEYGCFSINLRGPALLTTLGEVCLRDRT